ncbi:MAG TPA: phosphotransferase [Pseudoneobacillus sp.]|nr:phosphotransferase [Pseudoneobacillus sp.]
MNFINKNRGDEEENIRLLSSFQNQFPYKIQALYHIRDNVFKIITTKGVFVLKGYSSYSRLKLQETFSSSLRKEGFKNTYSFISLDQDPIIHQNKYFGCLEFIEPNYRPFSYVNKKERQEGLALLDEFHRITQQSVRVYQSILPEYDIQTKWTERRNQFFQNKDTISKYVPSEMISEWLYWADWSLEGIQKNIQKIKEEFPVILHGDVAHHNFLRRKDGKLFLIDFDLISIGPRSMDLLQYANRTLPFMNWDLKLLSQYKNLNSLLSKEVYIYALVYPTDLFREWNRLLRDGFELDGFRIQQVMNQSFHQMEYRRNFITELMKLTI